MRLLYLAFTAASALAFPAAAQTKPDCPLAAGVKEVPYGQIPPSLKQTFGREHPKIALPGGAFDAASEDSQRLIWVRTKGDHWAIAFEQGGSDNAPRVARYDITAQGSLSGFPTKWGTPETVCELSNKALGVGN
jgi:hypothetical protein